MGMGGRPNEMKGVKSPVKNRFDILGADVSEAAASQARQIQ